MWTSALSNLRNFLKCSSSGSGQNAWQTLIAYDACFRLCLNAWTRGCMEAPEFLRDECLLLRSAFGYATYSLCTYDYTHLIYYL